MNAKQRRVRQRLAEVHAAAQSPLAEALLRHLRAYGADRLEEGAFKTIADPDVPEKTRLNRINKFLSELGRTYHQGVPVQAILDNLRQNGFMGVQEDGTEWSGLVLGLDGRWQIDLVDLTTGKPSKRVLTITHHKMEESGRHEVVAYVN
jgi:hypothetical protein